MGGQEKRFFTYENKLISIMFFAYGLVWMSRLSIVYLFPFIGSEMNLNNTQLGLTMSIVAITWGISSVIISYLADIFQNKKKVLIICILIFAMSTFLAGIVGSFVGLLIARALLGLSEGPVIPLIQSTVLAESSQKRRGFNSGFVTSAYALLGLALTPVITVFIANAINWRYALYSLAIPGVIIALVLMKFMREPNITSEDDNHMEKPSWTGIKVILQNKNVLLSFIISIFYMSSLFALNTFMPQFLTGIGGYSQGQLGFILGSMGVITFIWFMVVPAISDKIGRKPTMIIFSFISVLLPLALGLFHQSFILVFIAIVLFSSGQAYNPIFLYIIPGESIPKAYLSSAIALIILVGEVVGGTVGPLIAGMLADQYSLYAPLWVVGITSLIVCLLSFRLKETAPAILQKRQKVSLDHTQSEPIKL